MSQAQQKSDTGSRFQKMVIFVTVFIYLLGFGIVIPILPLLSQQFGATPVQTGLLLSLYSLMQFLFAPFWGSLSDRFGRRPILLGCLLGEGLSYLMFAMADDLTMLFAARILAGFFGASISTASAAISDITPPHERSRGMALIGAAFGLGFVFGPMIGGLLSLWGQTISSEPLFATHFTMVWVAGICFTAALAGYKVFPETLAPDKRVPRDRSRLRILANKLRQPVAGPLIFVFFLATFAMSSMEANLVLYMHEHFAWGLKEVSFGFAYIGVIIVFTQGFLVRRMLPKIGERITLRLGLAAFGIGLAGIAFSPNLWFMALTMTALAVGNGLINPSVLGSVSLLSGTDEQGSTLGVTQSLSALGRILGPLVGGYFFQTVSTSSPFLLSAIFSLAALLIVIALGTRVPASARKGA